MHLLLYIIFSIKARINQLAYETYAYDFSL